MLRELLDTLKAKSTSKTMLEEFIQMIEKAKWMFSASMHILMGDKEAADVKEEIYATDREINARQRSIRRKIIRHLSIQQGVDVPICLVLMSVVKDAERLGDHCKNIYELGEMLDVTFDKGRYKTPLKELADQTGNLFGLTRKACEHSDEDIAHAVIQQGKTIKKQCDTMLEQLISDDLPTKKAVGYTLLARYIKRVSGHLMNVATSVLTPVDELDYTYRSQS